MSAVDSARRLSIAADTLRTSGAREENSEAISSASPARSEAPKSASSPSVRAFTRRKPAKYASAEESVTAPSTLAARDAPASAAREFTRPARTRFTAAKSRAAASASRSMR